MNASRQISRTHQAARATTPDLLADLLLARGADANLIGEQLAAQVGDRAARRLLAEAHGICADRLWGDAA